MAQFCTKYYSLNESRKTLVWAELFVAMAFYESNFNPELEEVDVGSIRNPDTWSIGLLQMSVVDQANLELPILYDYDQLKKPENNLKFGVTVMANQIKKRGKVVIAKSEKGNPSAYWAVIIEGGKYQELTGIRARVNRLEFCK